jgi:hypothetical protein
LTEARQTELRRAGISVTVGFGATETSRIGYGCLDEGAVNEVHLLSDLNAVIQPGDIDGGPSLPPRALLPKSSTPGDGSAPEEGRQPHQEARRAGDVARYRRPRASRPQCRVGRVPNGVT